MSKLGLKPTVEDTSGGAAPSEAAPRDADEPPHDTRPRREIAREETPPTGADGGEAAPQKGFSTKYQRGSLVEWLSLVEFVEGDALITIESNDGREGYLWCSSGQIVDARCDALTGEAAFFEIAGTEAGQVALTFAKVQRAAVIVSTTKELLLKAAARRAGQPISIAPSPPPASGHPVTMSGIRDRAENAAPPPSVPATLAPEQRPLFPSARAERQRMMPYVAIGALTLVLGAALMILLTRAFSRSSKPNASEATPTEAANVVSPGILAGAELIMDLDVDPVGAEIWLDDLQVGLGHARQKLVRDGREHEIRLVAPGYVAQSILFRDASLVRRVFMEKIVANRVPAETPPAEDRPVLRVPDRPAARPKRPPSPAPPSSTKAPEPAPAETLSAKPPEVPAPLRWKGPSSGHNVPKVQIVD